MAAGQQTKMNRFFCSTGQSSSSTSGNSTVDTVGLESGSDDDDFLREGEESDVDEDFEVETHVQTRDGSCCCCVCCSSSDSTIEIERPSVSYFNQKRTVVDGKAAAAKGRSFQYGWFQNHPWLSYCVSVNKAFCHVCHQAVTKELVSMPRKKGHRAFIVDGFATWKKARMSFKKHERGQLHREACMKLHSLKQPSVVEQLVKEGDKVYKHRQEMLHKVLTSLKFLVRQGLPIQGHTDEESNLEQLLKCRADDVDGLQAWVESRKYLSHEISNELIELMANRILRDLLVDIRTAKWFSIIADETRDISGLEQFAISLRWVNTSYDISEDLIGFCQVDTTDAATLSAAIKDILLRSLISLHDCRGQSYDGASNMSGALTGVATRIKQEEPRAHFTHCAAHCLNLCLQECTHNFPCLRDALSLAKEIYSIISSSPKRLARFNAIKEELHLASPGLKPICQTRWTVRASALNSIIKNYAVILEALSEISEAHIDASSKAAGFIALMEKFSTFFGLKFGFLLFSATEQASISLQYHDNNAQEVLSIVSSALSFLNRQRHDESFQRFYQSVLVEAAEFTDDPVLPRQKRLPRRIDDGAPSHVFSSPEELFRHQYFEAIDLLVSEIQCRFDQPTLVLLQEMEKVLIGACNKEKVGLSSTLQELYQSDLDMDAFKVQLKLLPDVVSTANKDHNMGISQVTSIKTL